MFYDLTEREYQCLGQWEEEGRLYAMTYRRDIHTYECFVGIIKPNGEVFIKEAGPVCSRGVNPEVLGMKLQKKGKNLLCSGCCFGGLLLLFYY